MLIVAGGRWQVLVEVHASWSRHRDYKNKYVGEIFSLCNCYICGVWDGLHCFFLLVAFMLSSSEHPVQRTSHELPRRNPPRVCYRFDSNLGLLVMSRPLCDEFLL